MHRVKSQNQRDAADHSWRDHAGMREFGIQPQHPDDQQDKECVGLDDRAKGIAVAKT